MSGGVSGRVVRDERPKTQSPGQLGPGGVLELLQGVLDSSGRNPGRSVRLPVAAAPVFCHLSSVRLRLLPFACLAAAACGGADPCPPASYDDAIDVPVTDAVLTVAARVTAHTTTTTNDLSIAIDDNLGTVTFPGDTQPIPAFVFDRTFLPGVQRNLYQGLAVADGSWRPFWFYCTPDGTLWYFYGERSDSSSASAASVSGPCS